jgi:hypothetical protein
MGTEGLIWDHYKEIKGKYPKLETPQKNHLGWTIGGNIDFFDDEGGYWDTYEVSIIIPNDYPSHLPELFEKSKKIERHIDWHNINGICCLSTQAIMYNQLKGNINLLSWLDRFVRPFLANHIYKLKTGHYANKEFEHGVPGIIQGYCILFGTNDQETIIEKIKLISGLKNWGRNDPCFCGSGEKYKNCFGLNPDKHFLGIPRDLLYQDLNTILEHLKRPKFIFRS